MSVSNITLSALLCVVTIILAPFSHAYAQPPEQAIETLNAHPPIPTEKAMPPVSAGEKRLHMHSLHTGETVDVVFWRNGNFVPEGLRQLKHFLRDHRSGDEIDMDPQLFALAHRLYEDLGAKGAIHIISGHRSAKTNAKLKGMGRNVAKKSQHILGTAMDIRIPGVPLKLLRETALRYKAGGVGYYPKSDFIHIDTGRPRQW